MFQGLKSGFSLLLINAPFVFFSILSVNRVLLLTLTNGLRLFKRHPVAKLSDSAGKEIIGTL
jgi:hypothetical protein